MTLREIQHFPLRMAYFCQDCGTVTNYSKACPACANGHIVPLAGMFKDTGTSEKEDPRVRFARTF
jgi:hypothetical protein